MIDVSIAAILSWSFNPTADCRYRGRTMGFVAAEQERGGVGGIAQRCCRGERGHARHVPGWTSQITEGGDEEKKNFVK